MLNGSYIEITSIIERVYRDTGFDLEINIDEVLEWTWDAMALIGAPQPFIDIITDSEGNNPPPITVENGRGLLPNDIYQIKLVRDYETKMPYICKSSPYKEDFLTLDYSDTRYMYEIRDNYIYTTIDDTILEIAYKGFPTTPLGLPMIPDNIKYIKAVSAYITERIARRLMLMDKITERKYGLLEQDWLWYVGAAKTQAQIPTLDQMESVKNRWLRLKSNPDLHSASFKYLPEKERLILHNNA